MSKEPWIDPARATFLHTVVKRSEDKRRAEQKRARSKEESNASPDAPTRPADPAARVREGLGPLVAIYWLGMSLNLVLAVFHLPSHFPQWPERYDWIIPGWVLAEIGVAIVALALAVKPSRKTFGFAGLTVLAVLGVGAFCGVLIGMGLVFLVAFVICVGALSKK